MPNTRTFDCSICGVEVETLDTERPTPAELDGRCNECRRAGPLINHSDMVRVPRDSVELLLEYSENYRDRVDDPVLSKNVDWVLKQTQKQLERPINHSLEGERD